MYWHQVDGALRRFSVRSQDILLMADTVRQESRACLWSLLRIQDAAVSFLSIRQLFNPIIETIGRNLESMDREKYHRRCT